MTSCAIIISHYESLPFLSTCIRQVRKYANPEVSQKIIIVDQSCAETHAKIIYQYGDDEDVLIVLTKPHYSGYGIDWLLRNVELKIEYICQIHVDTLPISKAWLTLPIKLIEENNYSFVGQLQFISKASDTIYPPSPFFAMAQCFNVAKVETYKELSYEGGFTRFHNRADAGRMAWLNNDWGEWAKDDYWSRGSDDDVVAFHWQDKYLQQDKLGLAITGFIEPSYGRIIEDIVFHFGSCREAIGVMGLMPEGYKRYAKIISEGYTDELVNEMVELAKSNRPPEMEILTRNHWDGKLKISSPPTDQINNKIEYLKNVE